MDIKHQVFISSQMTRQTLREERATVRKVIKRFPHFRPWDWENNGCSGEHTPMEQCLEEVERSKALVLIVNRTLTENTRIEYEKAVDIGLSRFIFFKHGQQRGAAYEFRTSLSDEGSPSWLAYKNTAELRSAVYRSLQSHCYDAELTFRPTIGTNADTFEVEA